MRTGSAITWAFPAAMVVFFLPCFGQTKVPRMPDGKPNFSGVWAGPAFAHNVGPNDTDTPMVTNFDPRRMSPLLPGAEAKFRQAPTGDVRHDDPTELCLPDGHPREALAPYAQQIVQTPDTVVFLYEYMHFFRVIPIDKPHPADVDSTFMGDAVAKWEGDTLVVNASNFTDATWFDRSGNFHSDALHVTERYSAAGKDVIHYEATIEDPQVFTRTWKISMPLYRRLEPNAELTDFRCVEMAEETLYGHLRKQQLVKHWEGQTMNVDITRKIPPGEAVYERYVSGNPPPAK